MGFFDGVKIRVALRDDIERISSLIVESAKILTSEDYTAVQIDNALNFAWGTDVQLIDDATYYVVEIENQLIGCGGWSYRKTLFGSSESVTRDSNTLMPGRDAAKIRAFFIKPEYARHGIGTKIMSMCESIAYSNGFQKLELLATLTGYKFYRRLGFVVIEEIKYLVGNDIPITFIRMTKNI